MKRDWCAATIIWLVVIGAFYIAILLLLR